jgi:hypothetical protein
VKTTLLLANDPGVIVEESTTVAASTEPNGLTPFTNAILPTPLLPETLAPTATVNV